MKQFIISCVIVALIGLSGCHGRHGHSHENGHVHGPECTQEHGHGSPGHSDEISFTREQAEAAGLTTERVAPGTFHGVIKASGHLQAVQGDQTTLAATANGIVSFVNPSVSEGITVKSGESIVTISSKHLQDGDPATKAKVAYETALKELQRADLLVNDQIISEKEHEQVRLRYEQAKTAYDAHALNMTTEGIRVTSPIDGFIMERLVNQGEYVSVGQPIATLARNRRMQVRDEVPEKHYKSLGSIATAHFKTAYDDQLYKLPELNGRLVSYGKTTGNSFYLPITFEFDNRAGILPGAYVEVFLLATPREEVLTIPLLSVTEEQGLYFVYLKLGDECYQKQEVRLGQDDGHRVEVLSGLETGDEVVVQGVYQVKLAALGSILPEGHGHSH